MLLLPILLSVAANDPVQDPAAFEAKVVELLLGEKGRVYSPSRPDYGSLLGLGERVIPTVLKHATDREEAPRAVATVLFHFAYQRFLLPKEGRDWLMAGLARGSDDVVVVSAVGLLGEDGSLPALEKRAGLEDARTACVAVQAISALGGAKAQASLERLKSSAPCLEARAQCKFLLDALFYPFQGDQADPRMLQAFEASKDQALKYAIPGGWFAAGERILRRWIRDRRADLVPKLREIADRQVAANRAVLDNPTDTYLRSLLGIRLLGGTLSAAETKRLVDSHVIDPPPQ
jgi:hypothetical protein